MWKHSPYRLRNVRTLKSVALCNVFHTSFIGYRPCCCLQPCLLTIHRLSWIKRSAPLIFEIWRLQNSAFWPLCVSWSSPMMGLLVITVSMVVCFCHLVVCFSLFQRVCKLAFLITGSFISFNGSAFDFASGYVTNQCSAAVDWTPCDTDERSITRSIWNPPRTSPQGWLKHLSWTPIVTSLQDVRCHRVEFCGSLLRSVE